MIFRQLFDQTSGTYSYLLASRRGGEALIIDPVLEKVDRYLALVKELDLHLVKAVDTHMHADHITGLGALRDKTHCITVMGEQTKADVVSMRLADGEQLTIEGLALDVIYTPGHTDDSYSFIMPDRVFTGDTLLIRGTGRTDFQNGDPRAQYESIFGRLLKLPNETLVYPAHDYKGDTVSTIGEEKAYNPRLQVKSMDEYVVLMNNLKLANPKMMDVAIPANMKVGLHQEEVARRGWAVSAADALGLLGMPDVAIIDLRERTERERHGTIPGSLHVPYPSLQENIGAGGMLHELARSTSKRLLFYCAFGERSAMAVQAAQDAGMSGTGYSFFSVTGLLDTSFNNGSLRFVSHDADAPAGVIYGDTLADLFYEAPPVKEFRKKYKLKKLGGAKHLLHALLKAYKDFGGKQKKPRIAIVEFRQPFQNTELSEYALLADQFTAEGFPTQIVSPDQLEYRSGVLRRGDFVADIVYRRIRLQDFLVRFDLSHPLMRAYKDHAVCMVNSFRSELGTKKAIFDLLTDDTVTAHFPAAERKAIKEFVPWTRMVQAAKTIYHGHTVDLPEFVMKHRTKLVLKPNDDSPELNSFRGADTDDMGWEKALRQAMRTPYVVQEVAEPTRAVFPLMQYGSLMMKEMQVDVHPHSFLGKVQGCSSWLSVAGSNTFSTLAGLAPTFLLEGK